MNTENAKDLKRGEFLLGDFTSRDLKSVIEHRPLLEKPARKTNERDVPFRSGSVLFDEKSYRNTSMKLELYFKAANEKERDEARDKITFAFDSGSYIPFIPYFDKTRVYEVHTIEAPVFEGKSMYRHMEKYTVTLSVKPFKKFIDQQEIVLSGTQTVTNPSLYESFPTFEIKGTGDMTLVVNGNKFVIKYIQDSITINTAIPSAYRIGAGVLENEEYKTYTRKYPYLKSGKNTISWTGGSITSVTLKTRWQTL